MRILVCPLRTQKNHSTSFVEEFDSMNYIIRITITYELQILYIHKANFSLEVYPNIFSRLGKIFSKDLFLLKINV